MPSLRILAAFLSLSASAILGQTANQVQLKIDPSSPTVAVSAEERVTAEPDVAVLHIGFITPPSDAKQAYAAGSKASNEIVAAIKGAGVAESSIRGESQQLLSIDAKAHRFQLRQFWAVRVPPVRAAEILDIAVNAGATENENIEWTVEDEKALEKQALEKAAAQARENAESLARTMHVTVGKLIYATNQISVPAQFGYGVANFSLNESVEKKREITAPLAIEPRKVSRTASVYAVFVIE